MTNEMTDIVEKLQSQIGDDVQHIFDHEALFKGAIDRITALEAELAEVRRDNVTEPTEPGAFVGDVFFGHPIKTTMGTHKWDGVAWVALPSETEALLELLAEARRRAETAEAALRSQRSEVLREAAAAVSLAAWKHDGDDTYSVGMDAGARQQNIADHDAILAMIDAPKEQQP